MIQFILISVLISQITGWQVTVDFDLKLKNLSNLFDKSEFKVFESVYFNNDYFALLSVDRNNFIDATQGFMMIGARNYLYQLNLPSLTVISSKSWPSSQFDLMQCLNRSIINNKDECDNYIKLYQNLGENIFRICSTNALNPKCRSYQLNQDGSNLENSVVLNETSGLGYSPLRAYENKYVYNYIEKSKFLYTANTIDLNRYFTSINKDVDQFRISTNMHDNNWLHRADFVNSFNNDERIFFVFNEDATNDESMPMNNRPIRRVPSIAQICLNDQGAALNSLRNIWTTYLKTRFSCAYDTSKSADQEGFFKFDPTFQTSTLFYFDELTSISQLYTKYDPDTSKNVTYFYGVFTTSKFSITASAVCMFTMDQIMSAFHGDYKLKSSGIDQTVPKPKPSECPSKLTYQHLIFSRKNFVMENEILSNALIVETASQSRFLSIDVQYEAKKNIDMLFVGTDNGRVLTFVIGTSVQNLTKKNQTEMQSKLIYSEELTVFADKRLQFDFITTNRNLNLKRSSTKIFVENESIFNVKLFVDNTDRRLILTTQNRVISLPAQYCAFKRDMNKCNNLIYPYCVWLSRQRKCVHAYLGNQSDDDLNQEDIIISNNSLANSSQTYVPTQLELNLRLETNKINESFIMNQLLRTNSSLLMHETANTESLLYMHSYFDLDNTKITISMNLILFIISLIAFLVLSFLIGVLTAYVIYKRVFNSNQNLTSIFTKLSGRKNDNLMVKINNDSILVNDESARKNKIDCSQLYSTVKSKQKRESQNFGNVPSVCSSSSSSSFSPTNESITKSTFVSVDNDPRYVYVNSKSKQPNLSILGFTNQRFQDYDDSEYFTLRKNNRKQFTEVPVVVNTASDSSSSSSPNSAQTANSTTKLVRSNNSYECDSTTYLNRTLPAVSVKCIETNSDYNLNQNNKKYYI